MKKVIFDIYLIAGMSEDTFSPKIMVDKPYDTISTSFTWDELIKLGIQRVSSLVEFIKTKNTDLHAEIGTYGIENFCYQNVYIKKGDYLIGLLEDKELANIFVDFQSDTLEFAYLYVAGGASLHCRGYRFDVHLSREQVHAFTPHVHVYHAGDVVRYYLDTFEPFVYDIEEDSFLLPVLSIQPLVENAVKHGIAKKRGGGVVTISSRQTDKAYRITVSDTGAGFDVDRYMEDGKVHVGLMNVRQRLSGSMNATVDVESTPGNGTTVTVTIPREKVNP